MGELVNGVALNVAVWLWLGSGALLLGLARGSRRRAGAALVFLGALWLSGTAPAARLAMRPLETRYVAPTLAELREGGVKRVVVLTGGGFARRGDLAAAALPHASTLRFVAGVELCARLAPECEIVFSGSAGTGRAQIATGNTMEELARLFAPEMAMTSEAESDSTIEHPQNVRALVGDAPFALVTSAYHMPRAMLVFERAGLKAVAYPVDYYTQDGWRWIDFVPSPGGWEALNLALHEYAGLAVYGAAR
jgi:uncharacterized SAM-binding protein YcdF (DUF218 family)